MQKSGVIWLTKYRFFLFLRYTSVPIDFWMSISWFYIELFFTLWLYTLLYLKLLTIKYFSKVYHGKRDNSIVKYIFQPNHLTLSLLVDKKKHTTCLSFIVHQTVKHILTKIWEYGRLTCIYINFKIKYNFHGQMTSVLNSYFDLNKSYKFITLINI